VPVLDFISGLFEEDEPAKQKQPDPSFTDYLDSVKDSFNPEVVYDTVTDAVARGATGVYNYVRTTTPRQFAEDAYDVGSAIVRGVADNPFETVVDVIPVIGDIKGYAEDIDQAAELRSQGDIKAAQAVAGPSLAMAAAGVIPGVGEARKGNKLAALYDVRPPKEDVRQVISANTMAGKLVGETTRPLSSLSGGVPNSPSDLRRVEALVEEMSGPDGYIERLIVDDAGNVIEGQHRLEALRRLGVDEVPVVEYQDFEKNIPFYDMRDAALAAGDIHPDQANQIASQLAEIYADENGNLAEVLKYQAPAGFQKPWAEARDQLISTAARQVSTKNAETMFLSPALSRNLVKYADNPDLLSRSEKRNVESYLIRANTEDSAWGARERMRLTGETDISFDRPVRETVSPEALQGETLIPIMGDRSIGGGELRSVQGVPLDAPVRLEGGPMFPFLGEPGWASMEAAARGKVIHINKAAEATGQAPIAMYTSMGDLAMDFNTMHAEAALRQLPALNVRPEAIEAFNAAIREGHGGKSGFRGIPEFPGILDEDALAMVRNEVPTTSAPNSYLRQSLGAAFRRAEFQDQGLPVHQDIVRAITEPDLVNDPVGYSGYSFFRGAPGFDVDVGDHTTYSHRIPRQGAGGSTGSNYEINVGGLDYTVPPDIMFPKQWAEISKRTDKHGKPLTDQMKVGALQQGHGFEVADQQWVDINMRYQEERRAAMEAKGLLEE